MAARKARRSVRGRARGTTWSRVCADGLKLPGVREGTSYRTPALFVGKKLLARLREDAETVAIGTDFLDREVLLEADPEAFFLTDHYRGYPWILMRLGRVRHAVAMEVFEQAWLRVAPARVRAAATNDRSGPAARGRGRNRG